MSSRALNDDEVLSEMNKMVAFIKQEAMEKAREIRAKFVKQAQHAIDSQYEKKRKQAEVSHKIAQSTQLNKSRLRLLQRREEHLQDLFSTARDSILELSADEGRYTQLLQGIIIQGLLQLMESDVTVIARPKDISLAEKAVAGAQEQYTEISGRTVNIPVISELPDTIAGGIKLQSGSRRITLDNTLDERLKLLESRVRLPFDVYKIMHSTYHFIPSTTDASRDSP
ncbi:hypothetical protein EW145_g3242 [Phellinidium pouzarii]|uniref:V-type proton ATPase subunit E n=1 Tax=Phellinidium pouzarii TaxID=167371 RepID=A0A4S4L837_9AGAM|nr:hypothetical protein EW145_g3242 [Phellinidium pouzarii]